MAHWKDSTFDFRSRRSSMKNARCRCCNSVSSHEIASDTGPYTSDSFFVDENGDTLCYECQSSYADQMEDFEALDEEDD